MISVAAEFLETDVTAARSILDRRRIGVVVPLDRLIELAQIDILNQLAVELHLSFVTDQFDLVRVPFGGLVDLRVGAMAR